MNTALVGTNTMYEELRSDIAPCIDDIPTKEKVCIDIVETTESNEFARESTIIGFKRYMKAKVY